MSAGGGGLGGRQPAAAGGLTWQSDALDLIGLAGVPLQLALGHGGRLAQVEEGQQIPHRRLLPFSLSALATDTT